MGRAVTVAARQLVDSNQGSAKEPEGGEWGELTGSPAGFSGRLGRAAAAAAVASLASAAWGGCGARWALGCLYLEACARLRVAAKEEPDGMSGLASLLSQPVLGRQLAEQWPKARG